MPWNAVVGVCVYVSCVVEVAGVGGFVRGGVPASCGKTTARPMPTCGSETTAGSKRSIPDDGGNGGGGGG